MNNLGLEDSTAGSYELLDPGLHEMTFTKAETYEKLIETSMYGKAVGSYEKRMKFIFEDDDGQRLSISAPANSRYGPKAKLPNICKWLNGNKPLDQEVLDSGDLLCEFIESKYQTRYHVTVGVSDDGKWNSIDGASPVSKPKTKLGESGKPIKMAPEPRTIDEVVDDIPF